MNKQIGRLEKIKDKSDWHKARYILNNVIDLSELM